jgi:hypothetical protein
MDTLDTSWRPPMASRYLIPSEESPEKIFLLPQIQFGGSADIRRIFKVDFFSGELL